MIRSFAPLPLVLALLGAGCVAAPECLTDTDCSLTDECVSGECRLRVPKEDDTKLPPGVECGERDACEGALDCESDICEDGCCAVSCASDDECRDDETCRNGWCRPIGAPCRSNNDCTHNRSTPACDLATGACVGCLSQSDCGVGQICENRGCRTPAVTGCTVDSDCPLSELPHCFKPLGRCVACTVDEHCSPAGQAVCEPANHACRPLVQGCGWDGDCVGAPGGKRCRDDRVCVQCVVDKDCPRDRKCLPDNTCTTWKACASDTDCSGETPRCRTSDLRCVECTTNAQCGAGKTCREGLCLPSVNGCASDAHCSGAKPVCDTTERLCVRCRKGHPEDCNGAFCRDDTCVPCEDSVDCLAEYFTSRPYCVSGGCRPCLNDNDCPTTFLCEKMECVGDTLDGPCALDGKCLRNQICVADTGGTLVCRNHCDPFAASSGCPSGKACAISSFQAGVAVGACVPKTPGRRTLGQTCSENDLCEVDLECEPSAPGESKCRKRCSSDMPGACSAGETCRTTVKKDLRGIPRAVGLCERPSSAGRACANDAQCDAGQICGAGPDVSQPWTWTNVCMWPQGAKTGGQSCQRDAECRSGLCIQGGPAGGYCQGGCRTNADCPARPNGTPGVCGQAAIAWVDSRGNPLTVDVPSCVFSCLSDVDCPASSFCEAVPNGEKTSWTTRCSPSAAPQASKGGTACRVDTECRSGRCLTFGPSNAGVCEGTCEPGAAGQCGLGSECPPNGVWRRLGSGPDGIPGNADDPWGAAPLCWPTSCTTNAQCGHGRVCAPDPDPLNPQDIVLSCHPTQGSVKQGGRCETNGDCDTGLCRWWNAQTKLCFATCETNADCSVGRCLSFKWTADGKTVKACAP